MNLNKNGYLDHIYCVVYTILVAVIGYLIFFASALCYCQEPLKSTDVPKIMQEMLEQHVEQREVSSTLLKNSFKIYIDQFDPDRIYFLQSEVQPLINPNRPELQEDWAAYRKGDMSAYAHINDIIQKAILRSRELRSTIERTPNIFDRATRLSLNSTGYDDFDVQQPFASTPSELQERIRRNIMQFITMQEQHFGPSKVAKKQAQVIGLYEKEMREHENKYLFQTELGKNLPASQREHLFTMNVLKALASSLDSHSKFLNPVEASEMQSRLEKGFSGTGIILEEGLDGIVIGKLIPGSPAAKSGLMKINDQLVEIDGRALTTLSYTDALEAMRGKAGTPITLTLKRERAQNGDGFDTITANLTMAPIVINENRVDVSSEAISDGIIGKIVLHSFYQGEGEISSEKDVRNAIKQLENQGNLKGLVLDLRNNSGGYLMQAIKVAGLFIRSGVIVISKYSNGEEKVYRDVNGKATYIGPLVILTSRATASAAEIVAEALQDYGVAIIVGDDHTYGKGSIQSQTVTNSQNANRFKVTVGKYYTVSGESPQIRGVQADVVVPGPYMKQHIGERYLDDSLSVDTIPAEYNDDLKDIEPQKRAWYAKHYTPNLQEKITFWTDMIPTLQQNSENRLREKPQFGDVQMIEAVNIIKDMLLLRSCQGVNCTYRRGVHR
jgi:carboxyl-terminal processing protease